MSKVGDLENLVQAIHLDHLNPSRRLLLRTGCVKEGKWVVSLYEIADGHLGVRHGSCQLEKVTARRVEIRDAIVGGFLYMDTTGRNEMLHILDTSGQAIVKISISASEEEEDDTGVSSVDLLEACFSALSQQNAPRGNKGKGGRSPLQAEYHIAEIRTLHSEIAKKDEEISHLQTKLASLKATVVRATASDNNKKKAQASPKKPANASALQPNAKRRKAVEDEFAGSDSD